VGAHAFVRALQRLVPSVRAQYLARTHSGIRAQALTNDGRLVDDFWFDRAERVLHVRNAPLTVSGPLGMVSELGSPATSVWLFAPCPFDDLGGVAAGIVGCPGPLIGTCPLGARS
jgi:hypothetical protein